MPLYDYQCAACGHRFEVIYGVYADGPTTCPSCGSGPLKKGFNAPAVHFKGSGWAKKERRATASAGGSKSSDDESGGSDSAAPAAVKYGEDGKASKDAPDAARAPDVGDAGGAGKTSRAKRDGREGAKDGHGVAASTPAAPAPAGSGD